MTTMSEWDNQVNSRDVAGKHANMTFSEFHTRQKAAALNTDYHFSNPLKSPDVNSQWYYQCAWERFN